jgi:hypothetical protein
VKTARPKSGLATITALRHQETARVQVLRSPSQVLLLPLGRPSLRKLNPGLIQIATLLRRRQRVERHVGLLPMGRASTWPISTNGTLALDRTERIAIPRYGLSTITAWESRLQRPKLLPQRPKPPPLLQVLQSLPEHRLGFLPIVRNGWKPKMATLAGLSAIRMVWMQACSTNSTQCWAKAEQIADLRSGQRIFTVWPLETQLLFKIHDFMELVATKYLREIFGSSALTRVNPQIVLLRI